jgi:putative DNA primase/helicase
MRERFPEASLVILADLGKATGQPDAHAQEAADAVGAAVATPDFGPDRKVNEKDFNDMVIMKGKDAVSRLLASFITSANKRSIKDKHLPSSAMSGWPTPIPLAASVEPVEYPIDAFPSIIREAVEEVAGFVKAPISMVALSALSTVSLALQAHSDVKRLPKLEGPIGLFILVIADSGERKSTCDSFFSRSITAYEKDQEEANKEPLKDFRAAWDSWDAKRNGVKDEIRRLAKKQESTSRLELALQALERERPKEPRVPRLLYADATPEALALSLAKKWPTGGVVSAEAGIVFGSHAMGKDSVMRNLALFNQLWDGATLKVDRKTSESFTVRGARLTIALQVQEPTLHAFFERSGPLARGTGFLARFVVAWPKSTQGTRQIDPRAPGGPESWPRLAAFNRRVAEILALKIPMEGDDGLEPPVLEMSPEATSAWIEYHNEIESQLLPGGEFYDVKDVASKSADIAARLAALFQLFAGEGDAISVTALNSASLIAAWHLQESRRFFGEIALPDELADAVRLDRFFVDYCRQEGIQQIAQRDLQRLGPVRDGERFRSALKALEDHFRVRQVSEGKRKSVQLNPLLLAEAM